MSESEDTFVGEPVGAGAALTLAQLCRVFELHADYAIELVEAGVVEPAWGRGPADWRFESHALLRMRRALRLHRDLAVDPAGAALALDLIEEVQRLRARVRVLERDLES